MYLKLYPFQQDAVNHILVAHKNRRILSFEMGLGKTPTAIVAAANLRDSWGETPRILVVTPAIVRSHWLSQFNDWWPDHPEVGLITMGRERKSGSKKLLKERDHAYQCPIQIVSPALLGEVDTGPWNLVVFDEVHRLKDPGAKQSKAAANIAKNNRDAAIFALSGTLIPNDVKDLWHPLWLLFGDEWGKPSGRYPSWGFCQRYSTKVPNEHSPLGYDFKGANPAKLPELRERLARVSSRVTKAEVAHLLPPFLVSLKPIDEETDFVSVEDWQARAGTEKLPQAQEWVEDALEQASHICILTWHKATAEAYAAALSGGEAEVTLVTGNSSPEVRNALLDKAKRTPKAIVVATMDSIGIGIDMTFCTQALLVELHWRLEIVLQVLGRFSRLSSSVPSSVDILAFRNSIDEQQARSLLRKVADVNKIQGAGLSENALVAACEALKETDEEVVRKLNLALESPTYEIDSIYS
jgi:superfamily II DNA or RNA helicase